MKLLVLALFVVAAAAAPFEDDSTGPIELIVNGVPDGEPLELGNIVDIKLQEHSDGVVTATNVLHPLTAVGIAEAAAAAVVEAEAVLPEAVSLPSPAQPDVIVPEAVVLPSPAQPEVILPEAVVLPTPAQPDVILPEAVVLPSPVQPEVILPEAVVLPSPAQPEVILPEAVVLPSPAQPEVILPEAVVLPSPAQPEVILPEAVVLPSPAQPEVILPQPVVIQESPELIPAPAAQLPNGEVFNDGVVQVTFNSNQESQVLSTLQSWFSMVMNYISNGTVQSSEQIV